MTTRPGHPAAPAPVGDGPVRRITGPAELIQAVPYLLGFHPRDSLVLVGLDAGRLVVTARFDLQPVGHAIDGPSLDLVATTLARMCEGGASDIVAAVYTGAAGPAEAPDADQPGADQPGADQPVAGKGVAGKGGAGAAVAAVADAVVEAVAGAVDKLPCRLSEALLVVAGRWWSLTCGPGCCPPEGRPVPANPSAFTAAATLDGVAPLADRAALAATLAPVPGRDALSEPLAAARRDAVTAAARGPRHERSVKRALFAAARASVSVRWAAPADDTICRYAAALRAIPVRDAVWLAVDERRLDGRPLWRELARRVPAPYDAAPLFLYGWASWRAGDGALARMAAERALVSDPDYSAADLLLGALARGLDPRSFPRLRRSA